MKKLRRSLIWILGIVVLVTPIILHAQITTGTLRGFVTDKRGEPLPGVTVELQSTSLMSTRATVTDTRGAYRILFLPPGKYVICAKLAGFGTCWQREVPVQVGKTSTANIEMEMAGVEETVTVTAEAPLIDTESSDKSYNLPIEMLATVPIAPRMNFSDVWRTLPGVAESGWEGNVIVNVGYTHIGEQGKTYFFPHHNQDGSYENKIMVDGMEVNCAMSGLTYAQFNYEAIQEIDVKTAGASAEYGNARSAFMNIVTKSGGNDLEGSLLFQYQPMSFNTTNIEGGQAKKIRYVIPGLTLSGPIMKDKIWFLASYKYDTQDYQFPDTIVVDKLIEKSRAHMPYFKLTFQPHKSHTISAVYQNDYMEIEPSGFPDYRRSTEETGVIYKRGGPTYNATWRWIITDSLYFNFLAGHNYKPRDTYSITQVPRIRYTDAYKGTTMRYEEGKGEEYYSVRESYLISGHLTGSVDDLWNTGSHDIKFGVEIRPYHHITRTRKYWKDEYGNYRYRYALDYEKYGLSEPYLWQATEVFPGDRYDNEGYSNSENVFIQDTWWVNKNLTLNFGVRWEHQRQQMYYRDELPQWMETIYPKMRENIEFDDSGFSPRLGLTYNWDKVGVFKFNFGRYIEYVGWNYHNYSTTIAFSTWRVDPADFGKGPEALKIYTQGQLAYNQNFNDIDNMKMEYHDEFLVSFERELFWNMAFETTFIYRKLYNTHQEDINALFEDGKFVDRIFPEFNNIWMRTMYEGDERRTYYDYKGLQVNLKRNFVGNWGLMINYSRMWRSYHKLEWDPCDPAQFVYDSPSDLNMINYNIRWTFHASAFYRFPWDIMISTYIMGQSGRWMNDISGDYAWNDSAPRVYLSNGRKVSDIVWEAKNSYWEGKKFGLKGRYTDQIWRVNVRFSKGIKISNFRVEASVDVFNIFNFAAYEKWETNDIRHPRYNEKINPQSPRAAQLNLRIKF